MSSNAAVAAYAELAPFYDEFTADHNYDPWAETLLYVARANGLEGRRLLDIACGTGRSSVPFLQRGFDVVGCDISPEMLELARARLGDDAQLVLGDVRALPPLGRFDLALALGDVLNYLLEPDDLESAFGSVGASLGERGLFIFDVNTLGAYRSTFAADRVTADDGHVFAWRGLTAPDAKPGATAEAVVEIFASENGHWKRATSRHVHRHHPDSAIRAAADAAGLSCRQVYGVTPDGCLHDAVLELEHSKRLYVLGPSPSTNQKGGIDAAAQEAGDAGRSGSRVHEVELTDLAPPSASAQGGAARPGQG